MSEGETELDDHEYAVASVEEVPVGTVKRVDANGRALAVVNADGEFFAISDACPHKGARFSIVGEPTVGGDWTLGELDEEECSIKCPYHFWEFDLETGHSVAGLKKRVPTFETSVVDGEVRVRLR